MKSIRSVCLLGALIFITSCKIAEPKNEAVGIPGKAHTDVSCITPLPSLRQWYKSSDAVFIGKVIKNQKTGFINPELKYDSGAVDPRFATEFTVLETFKGDQRSETKVVYSSEARNPARPIFKENGSYLVFAHKHQALPPFELKDFFYLDGWCTLSGEKNFKSKEIVELRFIKKEN